MERVKAINATRKSFQNDLKKLPPNVRKEAIDRIAGLINYPIPHAWRFHRLSDYKPNIYTIDVWPQKAYKASFNIVEGVAIMRRIGTHKNIDRSPE